MIVDEIAKHYKSGRGKKYSLGVITFNSSQQTLIEKLLDTKRLSDWELDIAIAGAETEELFIRTLRMFRVMNVTSSFFPLPLPRMPMENCR